MNYTHGNNPECFNQNSTMDIAKIKGMLRSLFYNINMSYDKACFISYSYTEETKRNEVKIYPISCYQEYY